MKKLMKLLAVPTLRAGTRPFLKLLCAFAALAAIAISLVSFKAPRVGAQQKSDHDQYSDRDRDSDRDQQFDRDQEERKIDIGIDVAPVPLHYEKRKRELVGLGSYIVNVQADCNGCHSQGPQTEDLPNGNPFFLRPPQGPYGGKEIVNAATYLGGGRDFGPFASLPHLYSRNLTPDKTGRPEGGHTFQEFREIMRTGKDYDHLHPSCTGAPDGTCLPAPFNGSLLQVMPWPAFQNMTDQDLLAIYEYLSAIPCIDTKITGAPILRNDCP